MLNYTEREVQAPRSSDWLCKMWYQMGRNAEKLDQITRALERDRAEQEARRQRAGT